MPIEIPVPAEVVWPLLRDVEHWADWNDGVESIALDGPVAVGTSFVMTPPGEDPITSSIVALREGAEISDLTEFEGLQITVRHLVTAAGAGSVVIYRITVAGPVPDEVAREVGEMVSADFPDVLANLSARAVDRAG